MLELRYQKMLKNSVDPKRIESKDYVLENPKLEATIKLIKAECPDKFHSDYSLEERIFYDEPAAPRAPVRNSGFVRPMPKRNRY